MRASTMLLALGIGVTVARPTMADPNSESAREGNSSTVPSIDQARAAFAEGRELIAAEEWRAAVQKFEYAARAKNTPGLRYYVGYCLEKEGQWGAAYESYLEAARLLESMPAEDVEKIIPEALARVRPAVARVSLVDLPDDATVFVNGARRPSRDELYLSPGRHTFAVEKAGYERFRADLLLEGGDEQQVQVRLSPVATRSSAQSELPQDSGETGRESRGWSPGRKVAFISTTSLSALGLGVGIVGMALSSERKKDMKALQTEVDNIAGEGSASCREPSNDLKVVCADLERAAKRRTSMNTMMVGGYVTAGVGALGALGVAFLWPDTPLQVEVGSDSVWLRVRGEF
jgi:hypothetical protein